MRTCVIALKLADWMPETDADYIGADRGALVLAQHGIRMKLAIGDFDSVDDDEFSLIQKWSDEVIRLNPIKDDSDSEAAYNEAAKRGYEHIILLDALGGRADQSFVNLMLAWKNPGRLILLDEQNRIVSLDAGNYTLEKEQYQYISFFTISKAEISLAGMKYPLDHRVISSDDLYTLSNEIIKDEGRLTIHEGRVLVIQARDRK